MTLRRLGLAIFWGAVAGVVTFFPAKAALTHWYMHEPPNDGQSALGVVAGSLYLATACGALTFGIMLKRRRRTP